MNEESMIIIDESKGKVELDRKLLRRNSPFLPYSIRIEILEYIEVDCDKVENSLYTSFGYFKTDLTRMIYQVFRCFFFEVPSDDCRVIPTVNTIYVSFFFRSTIVSDDFWKRKFSKFQNLKVASFHCLHIGIGEAILNTIKEIPKLERLFLTEDVKTFGLLGLENIIESRRKPMNEIIIEMVGFQKSTIDFFERKLHLVKHVFIYNFNIKGNHSPCEVFCERIQLANSLIGKNFIHILQKNYHKQSVVNIQSCEIESLEVVFNENTILSFNRNCVLVVENCYYRNSRNEKIKLPGFMFRNFKHFSVDFFAGPSLVEDSEEYIVFPDEMIALLNSFQKLLIVSFRGKIIFEELLKIKVSSIRVIDCLKEIELKDSKKLKKNNPKLELFEYPPDGSIRF